METKISRLLLDEHPLVILPKLAITLGSLNEAVVLQQVHYWIKGYEITQSQEHFHRGRYWVYNSYRQWKTDNFPFWSEATIKRTFNELTKKKLILSANFNKDKRDKTKWYTIDYEQLAKLAQNDAAEVPQTQSQSTDQSLAQIDQSMRSKCTEHELKLTTSQTPRKPTPAVAPTLVEHGPEITTENTTEITEVIPIINDITSPSIPESTKSVLSGALDENELVIYVQTVVDYFNGLKGRYPNKVRAKIIRPAKRTTIDKFKDGKYRAIVKWYQQGILAEYICDQLAKWIPALKTSVGGSLNYFENKVIDYISPERQAELDAYKAKLLEEYDERE